MQPQLHLCSTRVPECLTLYFSSRVGFGLIGASLYGRTSVPGFPMYQSRIDICQHLVPWAARVAVLAPNGAAWVRMAPCCYPLFFFCNQTGAEGHLAVLSVSSGVAEALLSLGPLSCLRAPSVNWLSGFADFTSLIPNPDAAYQCSSRLYGSAVRIRLGGRCWSGTTKATRTEAE